MDTKMKVMIIDDDVLVLESLARLLGREFEVMTTTRAEAAVELALRERPDAILCDLDMPDMTGGDVSTAFRMNRETAMIPVLYLTSYVSAAEVDDLGGSVGGRRGIARSAPLGKIVIQIYVGLRA